MNARLCVAAALTALLAAAAASAADASLELVQTIVSKGKAGKLNHLALDAKRGRLFLANKANNTLDVLDLKEGKLLKQIAGQSGVQGVAYAPDIDRLFAALGTGGLFNVFDGDGYKPLKTIKFTDDADNVRYMASTGLTYVAHAEKTLSVVDAKTYAIKADVVLPGDGEAFVLEVSRPRIYIACPDGGEVTVIDSDKNEVVGHYAVKMGAEFPTLALDEAAHRLYVGCRKEPMVIVMDAETGKELSKASIPGEIDDLHFDAKRKLLYASCGEGFVVVLRPTDAGRIEVVAKVPTAAGAKTSLFDADLSRLYVAVPRRRARRGRKSGCSRSSKGRPRPQRKQGRYFKPLFALLAGRVTIGRHLPFITASRSRSCAARHTSTVPIGSQNVALTTWTVPFSANPVT